MTTTKTQLAKRPLFSIKRAAMLSWANLFVFTVLGFITTPMVLNGLGPEGYGIWAVIISLSGYYGLANLGLGTALGRFVTRDVELGDLPSLQSTVDAATMFFVGTSIFILLVVCFLGDDMARWLRISDVSAATFSKVLIIASIGMIGDFFASISNSILAAAESYYISSLLGLCQRISQAVGTILVIHFKPGLVELTIVITANTLLFQIVAQLVARQSIPGLRIIPRGVNWGRLAELLRYGSGSILISVANLLRLRLGSLLIARYSSVAAVTNFAIATNLITNFNSVISSSTSVLGVRFTKLDASNSLEKLHQTYRMSLFATSFMSFGIGALMIIFADRFIIAWLGRTMPETVTILCILTAAYILSLCQGPGWNMMFARSKHHALAWVTLAESIANIVLGLFLSQRYGAVGFAWSTAITMSVTKLTFQPWYAARVAQISLRRFLEPMMYPMIFGVSIIVIAELLDIQSWLRAGSLIRFALAAIGFATVYVLLAILSSRKKDYMPGFITKALHRLTAMFGRPQQQSA